MTTTRVRVQGWLSNEARKARRDRAFTIVDSQVMELLNTISTVQEYTRLGGDEDRLIRMRDKALISLAWLFFCRGNENLGVRLGDVIYNETQLYVTITIEKKLKSYKVCPKCLTKNARSANFCRECSEDILELAPTATGKRENRIVTRSKDVNNPFCKPIVAWIDELRNFKVPCVKCEGKNCIKCGGTGEVYLRPTSWLFPRYDYLTERLMFNAPKHLTIQRFNQILQRLDPTLTSCLFRYSGAEKYLRLGYSPYEVSQISSWGSSAMPERYAQKKSLTPVQQKFAEDNRTTG